MKFEIFGFKFGSDEKPCGCDDGQVKCNIISSEELRKIRLSRRKERLSETIKEIKESLITFAKYGQNMSTKEIYIPLEFESLILEELAKCNINVDLNSRKFWDSTLIHETYGSNFYPASGFAREKHNKVSYEVSL